MNDVLDQLKRWQALAEKSRHGAAAVDYVTLRNATSEIELLRRALIDAAAKLYSITERREGELVGATWFAVDNVRLDLLQAAQKQAAGGGDGKSE